MICNNSERVKLNMRVSLNKADEGINLYAALLDTKEESVVVKHVLDIYQLVKPRDNHTYISVISNLGVLKDYFKEHMEGEELIDALKVLDLHKCWIKLAETTDLEDCFNHFWKCKHLKCNIKITSYDLGNVDRRKVEMFFHYYFLNKRTHHYYHSECFDLTEEEMQFVKRVCKAIQMHFKGK